MILYHLGTRYCQRVPLLPEQLIWSNISLFRRMIYIHLNTNKRPQLNLMRFLCLFTFHQLVDAWRHFANSASKVIMLPNNRNSRLQEPLFIQKQSPRRKLETCESRFCKIMEVTRVPPGRPSRTQGLWEEVQKEHCSGARQLRRGPRLKEHLSVYYWQTWNNVEKLIPVIKLVWPPKDLVSYCTVVWCIFMWIAGSAFTWYDALIIIINSNYFCWTWMFAYFVEFKTFTINVPVCPLNWIFLYFFNFQTFSNKSLIKTLSNKPRVSTKRYFKWNLSGNIPVRSKI